MKKLILFLAMFAVLTSCNTVSWTTMEIDQVFPASVNFPSQFKKVGIVDRVNENVEENKKSFNMNSSTFTQNMAKALADADFFDDVILCDSDVSSWERSNDRLSILTQNHVADLCEDLDVDLIVSVERCYSAQLLNQLDLEVVAENVLRLYVPSRERPLTTVALKDTLLWNQEMITYSQIREDAADYMAQKAAEYLAPYWKTVERTYYNGGTIDLRDAAEFVSKNDWDKAAEIWTNALPNAKGKLKEQLEYNLIVYDELSGRVDEAYQKCKDLKSRVTDYPDLYLMAAQYERALKLRVDDTSKLNLQMKRFE